MKAVVYKEPFRVGIEEVPDPEIKHPNDAIVRITSSCICGSDLHMYEGPNSSRAGHRLWPRKHGGYRGGRIGGQDPQGWRPRCAALQRGMRVLQELPGWVYGVLHDGQPRLCRRGIRIRGDGPVGWRTGGIPPGAVRRFQRAPIAGG